MPSQTALNQPYAMTIDVEEYFQVGAFEQVLTKNDWATLPSRLDYQISFLLDLLDHYQVKATFFCLGWVGDHHPHIIKKIHDAGHEIGCHGYDHDRVSTFDKTGFDQDLGRSLSILRDLSGQAVHGYRAPSFSIGDETLWAYEVMAAHNIQYSSSIYPVATDHYGSPTASRQPYYPVEGVNILEIPPTSLRLAGRNLPVAGGGYFRLFPYGLMRAAFRRASKDLGCPGNFYFHPWEIDPAQPRIEGASFKSTFRHRVNLGRMAMKIERLLQDFQWTTMAKAYDKAGIKS